MNLKNYCISLIFIFIIHSLFAQPDENYIKKLTGEVNPEWLNSVGNSIPSKPLDWTQRRVPGFINTASSARKQAILSQSWSFYAVDPSGNVSKAKEVKLPHSFDKNRAYNSAWYMTKFKIDQSGEKRIILKLNRIKMFSMVYLNGKFSGCHFGAFTPFETDVTDAVINGDNVLAIFVYDESASVDGDKLYNQISITRLSGNDQGFRLSGGLGDLPVLELREKASIRDIFVKTSTRKGVMEIDYELSSKTDPASKSRLTFEVLKWPSGEKVDLSIPEIPLTPGVGVNTCQVKWANAARWSPDHPNLYVLRATLKNGKSEDVLDTRFGFREFWTEGKNFMLNGSPIRLRGESHYHNVRYGVDFHREVFKLHKNTFGSNACRIHAMMPPADVMLGADEAGILLINQSSIWSVNSSFYIKGGEWFLKNAEKEFEEWVRRDRNCPSVVIWDVENEMLRFNCEANLPWISKLPGFVRAFDTTRPINCSGAGWYSPDQDMVSLHMQEHYTRIMSDWGKKGTTPLIVGEFWVGGRADQRLPNSPELANTHQRYLEEAGSYEDKILEMRYMGLSGMMPFRISLLTFFQTPHSAESFNFTPPNTLEVKKQPQDVLDIIRHCLQPVTVFFWPRQSYVAAGNPFQRELVICNDGETESDFEIAWKWENHPEKSKIIILQPAAQHRILIDEAAPANAARLIATVKSNKAIVSTDTLLVNPFQPSELKTSKTIQIYKDENLAKTLTKAGFKSISGEMVPKPEDQVLWVIPEHANNRALNLIRDKILDYLNSGGNMLCLKQDGVPTWFPMKFRFSSSNQSTVDNYGPMGWEGLNKDLFFSTVAPIYASSHPVFSGLNSSVLSFWNKFDRRVCDDVFVRPSGTTEFEKGNWRPLAGGTRMEQVSLAELFYGKGTLLSCQLHVIDNLDNVQAKSLFVNMLNYLADKKPVPLGNKIALRGNLKASDFAVLTGASEAAFEGAIAGNHDLMIATDGASLSEIKTWASEGGKVIVFSDSLSQAFEGVKCSSEKGKSYWGTKSSDHPLIYGVSSASFMNNTTPNLKSYFSAIPPQAKVLLQGVVSSSPTFWKMEDAGPVMIEIPYSKGTIIVSTIEMGKNTSSSARELLNLILTNSGVGIPFNQLFPVDEVAIKKTVPITVDGKLTEWLEDRADKLLTPYIHAQPVYLTSENTVAGPPAFDLNLSAISYFLWNPQALHVAGVVFMEKRFFGTEPYPGDKEYRQEIRYNQDVITVSFKNREATVLVNGKPYGNVRVKAGKIDSKDMTDATSLQFDYIHASGKLSTIDHLTGDTFEVLIPWEVLTSKSTDVNPKAMISIESKGSKIQIPLNGNPMSGDNWMNMKIK